MTTHAQKRAAKRAAAALAAGLTPSPTLLPTPAPVPEYDKVRQAEAEAAFAKHGPKKAANRALSRRLFLMLAAVKLSYRTALVDILSQYRQALVTALLHYGGWDPRAVAVEGHYLLVLHGLVGHAFDQMWPKLVKAIEEQAKAQGLPVVIPEKETWKQSSVVLMEKSARELGTDMRRGGREDDIGVGRASVIAENEIGRMAASANEAAQRAAGVTSFVWSGMMDDRERPEHVALEGRVFSWDTDHYKPGEQVNCRCWPVAVTHLRA